MDKVTIFIIVILLILLLSLAVLWFLYKKAKDRNNEFTEAQKKNTKNKFKFLYRIYKQTPVIKRYLSQLLRKYQSLFPADEITIEKMATNQMTRCLAVAIGLVVAMTIICQGDIPYLIIGIVGAYIFFTHLMNTSAESLERKLMEQLDTFIDDLTAYYHDSHDVVDAVEKTLDDLPYEISLHAQRIHQIITSTEKDYEMEEYIAVAPNQYLLLTAAVCASISEYGDKDIDDKSLFLTNLNYIKEELNQERLHLLSKKMAYAGKVVGIIAPLFLFKFAESIMVNNMPDVKSFYKGSLGTVAMAIILLIDVICYELINISKNTGRYTNEVVEPNEKLEKISKISFIKRFLMYKQRKSYTKSMRTAYMLQGTGSADNINTYTIKRWLWGIVLFVSILVLSIYSNYRSKTYIFSDFSEAFGQVLVPNEEYRQKMRNASEDLQDKVKRTDNIEEEVSTYLDKNGLSQKMAEDITAELTARKEQYNNYYYRWWMLLLGLIGAGIGYMIPYIMLRQKAKIMEMRRNEEVSRMKVLIMIFMHMDGMMLDDVLVWMARFANIYKPAINECIMNYESGQQKAIAKMREDESGFAPFRRLCDSLLSVDNVGLEYAFDSLQSDREFENKKREKEREDMLKKEAEKAQAYMMIPIWALVIGFIMLPFAIYAFNMAKEFLAVM